MAAQNNPLKSPRFVGSLSGFAASERARPGFIWFGDVNKRLF